MRRNNRFIQKVCILTAVTAVLLSGCSKASKTVDASKLATRLATEISYQDEITTIDLDTASMIYYFDDANINQAFIYEGSGATAEEVAVFDCATEEDAAKVETAVNERVEEQKESFRDYVPEELNKLDAAVVQKTGCYVVLSVSNDADTAKKIIGEEL